MCRKLPGSDFFLFGVKNHQAHGSFPNHRIVTAVDILSREWRIELREGRR